MNAEELHPIAVMCKTKSSLWEELNESSESLKAKRGSGAPYNKMR